MFHHHSKPFHHLRPYQIERRAGVINGISYLIALICCVLYVTGVLPENIGALLFCFFFFVAIVAGIVKDYERNS